MILQIDGTFAVLLRLSRAAELLNGVLT